MTNMRTAGSGDYSEIKRLVKLVKWANETGRDRLAESIESVIGQMPLSVTVRDGWREPGAPAYDGPEEFEILLGTGGPAVRIWGTLGEYGEADRVELQNQDWYTPWERVPFKTDADVLRAFCNHFYFGG